MKVIWSLLTLVKDVKMTFALFDVCKLTSDATILYPESLKT